MIRTIIMTTSKMIPKKKWSEGKKVAIEFFKQAGWDVIEDGEQLIITKDGVSYLINIKCGYMKDAFMKSAVIARTKGLTPALFFITDDSHYGLFVWRDI